MSIMADREQIIGQYVTQLLEVGSPLGIVLFGSQASGIAGPDSDVDLLIIEQTDIPRHRRAITYRQALHPHPLSVDLLVRTAHEIQRDYAERFPLIVEILSKGRWLHGNPRCVGFSGASPR